MNLPVTFSAEVIHGEKLSFQTGYPTANLPAPAIESHALEDGVYAVWVQRSSVSNQRARGALIVGVPFQRTQTGKKVEVHLLDVTDDLYGETLRVSVVKKLREVIHTRDAEKMRAQIKTDLQEIKKALKDD